METEYTYIGQLVQRYPQLAACADDIISAYRMMEASFAAGGKLLVAGNGGSAADSDHLTGELLKSFKKKRRPDDSFFAKIEAADKESADYLRGKLEGALPAIALSNQTALMTASLNDVDGSVVFAQQVHAYGKPEDVFFGISTSGNSKDVIYAAAVARAQGLKVISLTGRDGGRLKALSDACIIVPQTETFMIQELHLPVYHALCLQLEEHFFPV